MLRTCHRCSSGNASPWPQEIGRRPQMKLLPCSTFSMSFETCSVSRVPPCTDRTPHPVPGRRCALRSGFAGWLLPQPNASLGRPMRRKPARNAFAEAERIIHHVPWEYPSGYSHWTWWRIRSAPCERISVGFFTCDDTGRELHPAGPLRLYLLSPSPSYLLAFHRASSHFIHTQMVKCGVGGKG